ncbi:hypothetical protein RUND412_003956 [Rhizina undulata]
MALWEKMLLVLAAAMALTLFAGIVKVIYTSFRIKKYTQLAAARKSHLENVRNSRNVIQLKSDDVPFGIRAIEAGIEVEGIVISRPSTPNSSRPNQSQLTLVGSDADSLKSGNNGPLSPGMPHVTVARSYTPPVQQNRPLMVYQPSPYLALPPASRRGGSGTGSNTSSATSSPPLTRAPSAERPGANTHMGTSQSGYSTPRQQPPTMSPEALALAALEGRLSAETRGPPYQVNGPASGYYVPSRTPSPPEAHLLPSVGENEVSEDSSRESDFSVGSGNRYSRLPHMTADSTPAIGNAHAAYQPVPELAQGDLSLLHTHRLSHAAEVGQLLPRRRDRISQAVSNNSSSPNSSPPSSPNAAAFPQHALDIVLPSPTLMDPPVPSKMETLTPNSQADVNSRFTEGLWYPGPDGTNENTESGILEGFEHDEIDVVEFEPAPLSQDQRPVSVPTNGPIRVQVHEETRNPTEKKGKRNLLKRMRLGKSKNSVDLDLEAQK